MKRHKTKYPGVFYRMVERLGGPGQERMYYVVFKRDGGLVEEKAGRQYANRMTEGKASRIRAELIEGRRKTRKELREEAKDKDTRWTVDNLAIAYFESLEANPSKSRKALSVDRNRYENFIKPKIGAKEPAELLALDLERLRGTFKRRTAP